MPIKSPAFALDCDAATNLRPSAPAAPVAPLPKDVFTAVVANAPLISIDLIIENSQGAVLLGLRNNPPAKGYWFAPGGRIRKDESLDAAFTRIAHDELGEHLRRSEHSLTGVHEHFYDVDFNGMENASTHYIVLAYRLRISPEAWRLPHHQHSRYQWMRPQQIVQHPDVHPYTKAYFLN